MSTLKKTYLTIASLFIKGCYYFQIGPLQTFDIHEGMDNAGFMKKENHMALCLNSNGATYEKGIEYYIQDEQRVIKTCK